MQRRMSVHIRQRCASLLVALVSSSCLAGASAAWPPEGPIAEIDPSRQVRLPPSIEARARADGRWELLASIRPEGGAERIVLAGDFNGWSRDATPLARGADGVWRTSLVVPSGVWSYKFIVDGRWLPDPLNRERVDDGHGGENSVLRLGAVAARGDAALGVAGDGRIEVDALGHEPARTPYRQRGAEGHWIIRYRTLAGDVERVELLLDEPRELPMTLALRSGGFDLWEAVLPAAAEGRAYTFRVVDGATALRHPEIQRLDAASPALRTPEWAKHAIWYQIMPERFRNGDAANDPKPLRPWRSDWYEPSGWELDSGRSFHDYVYDRRYGGDLQGVREKLGYLKELGVNAIYFTPIFHAESLHKYDATSYVHVDEHLGVVGDYASAEAKEDLLDPSTWTFTGSDRVFLDFLREAKALGFRVVVDGVFNHVGTRHPALRDVREKGAASRYADWFSVRSWEPFEYEGWAGFGSLPAFRKDDEHGLASATLRAHIAAITRRWMDPDGDGDPSDGVDGWRLDVPNEVPMAFWREWRALVKSINPEAYLVGEIWRRADDWLDGASFDAVMNYQFAEAALAWVGNRERRIPPSEVDRRLAELRVAYPEEASLVLQNLLGSHDTDRLLSMLENPDRDYNRENRLQDGATDYFTGRPSAESFRKARLLLLLQMTYVGAPMIWYGDEVGMWGANDPSCRKPMLWKDLEPYAVPEENRVDEEHLAFHRAAIALRNATPALRVGAFRTLLVDDAEDVWVFERTLGEERIVVALNASGRDATVALPLAPDDHDRWREIFRTDGSPPFAPEGRPRGADFPTVVVPRLGGRVWSVGAEGGAR